MTGLRVVLTLLLLGACARPPKSAPPELTADEGRAVAVAEEFVRVNGYTSAPATISRMQRELTDFDSLPQQAVVALRRNSLKPQAYGISHDTRGGLGPGWTVYFEFTDEHLKRVSSMSAAPASSAGLRGVEMSPKFDSVVMTHTELRRDAPTKLVPRSEETSKVPS